MNTALPKYKENLRFPLRFVRWLPYFEFYCDKNVIWAVYINMPNVITMCHTVMENLDLYLDVIIFNRPITFLLK